MSKNAENYLSFSETAIEQLTYEQAFSELEAIVALLESEQHSLEESIALFERGQKLASRCASLLDQAELRIKQIIGDKIEEFDSDQGN